MYGFPIRILVLAVLVQKFSKIDVLGRPRPRPRPLPGRPRTSASLASSETYSVVQKRRTAVKILNQADGLSDSSVSQV